MKKYLYDDIDDVDDIDYSELEPETDGFGTDDRIVLDNPDDLAAEDDEDDVVVPTTTQEPKGRTILNVLRDELKIPEYSRGSLDFKWNGDVYEGVPMLEINPDKFVFKLLPENKLKSFKLSEIVVVDAD